MNFVYFSAANEEDSSYTKYKLALDDLTRAQAEKHKVACFERLADFISGRLVAVHQDLRPTL